MNDKTSIMLFGKDYVSHYINVLPSDFPRITLTAPYRIYDFEVDLDSLEVNDDDKSLKITWKNGDSNHIMIFEHLSRKDVKMIFTESKRMRIYVPAFQKSK